MSKKYGLFPRQIYLGIFLTFIFLTNQIRPQRENFNFFPSFPPNNEPNTMLTFYMHQVCLQTILIYQSNYRTNGKVVLDCTVHNVKSLSTITALHQL